MKKYSIADYKKVIANLEGVMLEDQTKHTAQMHELAGHFMRQIDAGNAEALADIDNKMRQCESKYKAGKRKLAYIIQHCKEYVQALEFAKQGGK